MLDQHTAAWKVLVAAGVPLGAPTPASGDRFVDTEVRAALAMVLQRPVPSERERDALAGWAGALRAHFPARAAGVLADAADALARLAEGVEAGRYLKLRRVALGRLARLV